MAVQVELAFYQRAGAAADVESYQIGVIRAPGRGWGGPLLAGGLDDGQASATRQLYAAYLQRQQRAWDQPVGPSELEPLRAIGNQLFTSFPETVQARLHQALALARQQGRALELVLIFEPSAQALLSLPWELLHSPQGRFFFGLRGSLTRRLALPAAPARTPRQAGAQVGARTILGIWAEPRGLAALTERRQQGPAPGRESGAGAGIVWQEGPGTLARLEQALAEGGFEALHVVAHGRGGEAQQDFALALEDANGEPQWFSSDQLATLLGQFQQLQWIYLDVCAAGQNTQDNYAPGGLAVALLQAGVPAVVVMQEDMAQRAAGLLAHHFYAALHGGNGLSAALSAGRRAVRVQQDDPIHWSVPALYAQQRTPQPEGALRPVDALLDGLDRQQVQGFAGVAALLLLLAHLSFQFASSSLQDTFAVALLLAQSALLPLLGALLSRAGEAQLREKTYFDSHSRREALQAKYFSAAVWSGMAWLVVLLLLLGLTWGGFWPRMGLNSRQLTWAIALSVVALAGYSGARQSLRQSLLFFREGSGSRTWGGLRTWRDWLVTAALLFMPLMLYAVVVW